MENMTRGKRAKNEEENFLRNLGGVIQGVIWLKNVAET